MSAEFKSVTPTELDKFVAKNYQETNFLQSSNWGKVYELTGNKVHYLGLYKASQLIGSCVAIVKPAKRGRYLEIADGPLLDWQKPAIVKAALSSLKQLATAEKCVFIRLRPNLQYTEQNCKILRDNHLHPSPMHLHAEHTVMLDLAPPVDQILEQMRRQTRYEVRRANKLGIKVTSSTSASAFKEFYKVQLATAKRQNFIPSPESFILAQHQAFGSHAKIYKAELDGKPLAYGLIIMQPPEAVYHEAASTPAGRSLPGAYAIQWQVIKDAKAQKLGRYNLFGIAGANQPHHRYAGVTVFKTGFGGKQINYVPAQDIIIDPLKYQLTKLIETIRKKRRNL